MGNLLPGKRLAHGRTTIRRQSRSRRRGINQKTTRMGITRTMPPMALSRSLHKNHNTRQWGNRGRGKDSDGKEEDNLYAGKLKEEERERSAGVNRNEERKERANE